MYKISTPLPGSVHRITTVTCLLNMNHLYYPHKMIAAGYFNLNFSDG